MMISNDYGRLKIRFRLNGFNSVIWVYSSVYHVIMCFGGYMALFLKIDRACIKTGIFRFTASRTARIGRDRHLFPKTQSSSGRHRFAGIEKYIIFVPDEKVRCIFSDGNDVVAVSGLHHGIRNSRVFP